MARIKIEIPTNFQFQTTIPVRITDVNYGGHVGNDAILSIMQEARTQFIMSLGYKDEISITDDIGTIVTDAAIEYKAESFYGDELSISISIDDFNKYGFDIYYQIKRKSDNKEIAKGKTGIVCFNYTIKKIAALPASFLEALQQPK